MIPVDEALSRALAAVDVLDCETVPVYECQGRVLAEDVLARIDSPPFNKAAMDGYAVRAEDVSALPTELQLVGEVFAGEFPEFEIGKGEAAVITTGAPVPPGADMVVMVEHTEQIGDSEVRVKKLSGGNICKQGEDITAGSTVLRKGTRLDVLHVGVAAAAGYPQLSVHCQPSAAILCTGTEVVEPGGEVGQGQIYNSNGPILRSLLNPVSEKVKYLGTVGDDRERLLNLIQEGLQEDLFIISGGVSMGQYDLVPGCLEEAGVKKMFHKCAMKPGKPTWFGCKGDTLVFGMPGNPLSCFVVFHVLVRPVVDRMIGIEGAGLEYSTGRVMEGFSNKGKRAHFIPARLEVEEGEVRLRRLPHHGSADIMGSSA
ncbi:MAG: molybdopterin molybdotransferase MoeA, partial [Planctomycetes bacterium]|nr:molybdopterin molybdotransferase MoeA [Planctomycetota bacterium]